jgi:bifunctional oligoribonuclease and PAP phosphatase NrnA
VTVNPRPTPPMAMTGDRRAEAARVAAALSSRQRFVLSSHARPDGDSIGSQIGLALALEALGKDVAIVNRDPVPAQLRMFPGVERIRVAERIDEPFDAAIILECSNLARTGVDGLDQYFIVNIDHHTGNTSYGAINWFDPSAAACAEMVFDVVEALGAPLTPDLATQLYVGILTDTGSFHYAAVSARTFDICARLVEAGVEPQRVARAVFDSNTVGRLKLFGAVLHTLQIVHGGKLAVMYLDDAMARSTGGSSDDTDGLINLPLTVRDIRAVAFLKEISPGQYRVSLRSKGAIDVAEVAKQFGGGGHKNAAGCGLHGTREAVEAQIVAGLVTAIDRGLGTEQPATSRS